MTITSPRHDTNEMTRNPRHASFILPAIVSMLMLTACGCSLTGGPRMRLGCLPTATFGISFPDPNKLGQHAYGFGLSETGGIVYTCRGGHIDIDHVRGSADLTYYLVRKSRQILSEGKPGFSFVLTGETSRHIITFTYPPDWKENPDKQRIAQEASLVLGPYLAMNATTWHEILTWFGVHFGGFEPEFNSAFSWEDTYSNLLGTRIAIRAIEDSSQDFDKAMTSAIQEMLAELGVQPRETAISASDKVRGSWYTGNLIPDLLMRNFDIGLDGSITPTIVDIGQCKDSRPLILQMPSLDILKSHGLAVTHEIKPNVFEQGAIFKAAGSKTIIAQTHFPILLEHIIKDARSRGYTFDQ